MQKSHRRSTKVCTRCRKRKTKCDFKFPACTACKLANEACFGYDPTTKQAVPRSLVRSLEAKVAELEAQMRTFKADNSNLPYLMASKIAQATTSATVSSPGLFFPSKVSPELFFRPSCPPLAVVRGKDQDLHVDHSSSTRTPSSNYVRYNSTTLINLDSVPRAAISRMVQNYINIHLPQYPCVSGAALNRIVQRAWQGELGNSHSFLLDDPPESSGVSHFEYFILLIVLALSSMTLTWKDNDQARAASESFYSLALRHLQAIPTHSEIQALQISLLLAHYGHMCPERVDNWTCISNAIRIVLNLGLHLESPQGLSEETIRERTNLFWVAYGMERSLCTNLRLPLSFPEESIAVKLDPIVKDPFQQNVDIDRLLPQSASSHICHYRALETEVHRVLHLEEDLQKFGCDTIENWTTDISSRLGEWYETAKLYTPYNMLEFKAVQFHHLIARIHRPTPRLRTRSAEDRQMVLNASLVLIDDYLSQERRRRLFYPWHGVHILFETAIIALEACWSSRHWDQAKLQAMSVLEVSLPQCLDLLRQIGQRWNEASLCADRLEPLIKQVHSVLATTGYVFDELEAPITKEIDGLLFPDAPLIWNRDASQDFTVGVADGTDFLNSFLEDGLEFFQWDPEWDIMSSETL